MFCLLMNFLEIIGVIFELLCICSFWCHNVVTTCIPCHIWFMKWIWLMILVWDLLDCVLNWLRLIHVEFHVLFWIISPSLTLGLDLVVCDSQLSFDFRLRITLIWLELLTHLSWLIGWCWLTLSCFVGWCQVICVVPMGLWLAHCCIACLSVWLYDWLSV